MDAARLIGRRSWLIKKGMDMKTALRSLSKAAAVLLVLGFTGYREPLFAVEITESVTGPYTYAYIEFTGPYQDMGPVFERLHRILTDAGIPVTKGIRLFFDNPAKVPAEKLRGHCGSIIDEKYVKQVAAMKNNVKIGTVPSCTSVIAELPMKNRLAKLIKPENPHPALRDYIIKKRYSITRTFEIYDITARKIYYVKQVVKKQNAGNMTTK